MFWFSSEFCIPITGSVMENESQHQADCTQAKPQREHEWLEQLVGEWTFEAEASMGPGQPSMKSAGTESVRSLGGLWIVAEGRHTSPDGTAATTIMTVGYDPAKKAYVGSWIGSMMTFLWVYDGSMNEARTELTLAAEGPSMKGDGSMASYRDVIHINPDGSRALTSHYLGEDGNWTHFMTATYKRVS
jgi:hypothetical protein